MNPEAGHWKVKLRWIEEMVSSSNESPVSLSVTGGLFTSMMRGLFVQFFIVFR